MENVLNWIAENQSTMLVYLLLFIRFAEVVVNLTATETDNKILAILKKFVGGFSQTPKTTREK